MSAKTTTSQQARLTPAADAGNRVAFRDPSSCRAREVLDLVADKWSLYVVSVLGPGPLRFTEIKRSIEGISQRMLTVTLRGLERDGILTRTVHAVMPPNVAYELTPMGHTLLEATRPLITWSLDHLPAIDAAREAFDQRASDA
jgi:DNA-binding HxlR family transcriptional regulator